jgi:exosortase A
MGPQDTTIADESKGLNHHEISWSQPLMCLTLGFICITTLFWSTVIEMMRVWENSAAYGHCWLIPFVSIYLVWDRRLDIKKLQPVGYLPGCIFVFAAVLLWIIGWAAGVNFVMQFAYILMLQGLVLATFGTIVVRGLLFPLLFLLFAVPFGEEFIPFLQSITVWFCIVLLKLFNIPFFHDGVFISLAVKDFQVAEECSGIRYMTAMAATAVLFAHIGFESWKRRFILIAIALIVPIIANGLRAFGIIYIAYLTDGEYGTGIDHILYGWVFFGIVMALVIYIGHFFMDKPITAPAMNVQPLLDLQSKMADTPRTKAWLGTVVSIIIAAITVGYTHISQTRSIPDLSGKISLPTVAGWRVEGTNTDVPWIPNYDGASRHISHDYTNAQGRLVTLYVAAYATQTDDIEMIRYGHGVHGSDTGWTLAVQIPVGNVGNNPPPDSFQINGYMRIRDVFQWYYVNGKLFSSAKRAKAEVGIAKLLGRSLSVATVAISEQRSEMKPVTKDLEDFVQQLGSVEKLAQYAITPTIKEGSR